MNGACGFAIDVDGWVDHCVNLKSELMNVPTNVRVSGECSLWRVDERML